MNNLGLLRLVLAALLLLAGFCSPPRAAAIVIDLPYVGAPLPGPVMMGLSKSATIAKTTWESFFSDPVELKFSITAMPLAGGALGYFDVDPTTSAYSYVDVKSALIGDATSADDLSAITSLQPGPALSMITQDTTKAPTLRTFYADTSPLVFNSTLRLTSANQKALGLIPGFGGGVGADGTIVLNSTFLPIMDFDPGDGISAGMFDLTAILIHELAHGMGFISGVDHIDYASSDGAGMDGPDFPHDYSGETIFTVLDLYRYSGESTTFIIQPSSGAVLGDKPYFSIDAGTTDLAKFASGVLFGDGDQAQHWEEGPFGLMDPTIGKAELGKLSPVDIKAMDVIGWTLVPEPGSFALAVLGLAMLTVVGWRRRRAPRA